MLTIIANIAAFLHHHIAEISFGITAVVLMLGGPIVNGTLKRLTKTWNWVGRFLIFVLLCTLGYSVLSHLLFVNVKSWLTLLPNLWLMIVVVLIYLGLAWLAWLQREI